MTKLLAVFRIGNLQIEIPETQQYAHIYLFIRRILIHVTYSSFYSYLLCRYYNILFLSAFVLSVVISIIMETIERINHNQAKYFQFLFFSNMDIVSNWMYNWIHWTDFDVQDSNWKPVICSFKLYVIELIQWIVIISEFNNYEQ